MTIKGAKTIAEYAIRKWMSEQGFEPGYFTLTVDGCEGAITDKTGDNLRLIYDPSTRSVEVVE